MGLSPVGAGLLSALWELSEDRAKPLLSSTFPAEILTLDSKANAICDIVAVIVGAGIGARMRP
jgi:hypothetical protein